MKIFVTENKSVKKIVGNSLVRVFIDNDFHYGFFVPELRLFGMLTEEQKVEYLSDATAKLDVSDDVIQFIKGAGHRNLKVM